MLKSIYIQNFALAQQLQMDFQQGLNILTGETGTGKSILIGAISAVLGGRISTDVVRAGAEKALVEAIFEISTLPVLKDLLKERGLDNSDEIILRREIPLKGSSRAFINDIPITITTLSEIGDLLVDIHSQNEHQSLLKRESHRYFIDSLGKLDQDLSTVARNYKEFRKAEIQLQELEQKRKSMDEKYDFYLFQMQEIEKAHLRTNEPEQLENERKLLINAEKIYSLASQFNELIEGPENSLSSLFGQALQILQELADFSPEIHTISHEFASAQIILEEASRSVEEFQNKIEYNPTRLEEIEQRLATISLLKKKYGKTIEEILSHLEFLKSELNLRENIDDELHKATQKLSDEKEKYSAGALKLSSRRQAIARKCEQQVEKLLKEIGMPKIRFRVDFQYIESPHGTVLHNGKTFEGDEFGMDQIEFNISPNPGEDFKPLARIASGGEISRIMLALKNILAESDRIPLLIFDEIDAGVSGQIALAVGKNIHNLSSSHQIICITHLPQIASFGSAHYRVEKYVDNGRTFTRVNQLNRDDRIKEIAGLMGGKKLTDEILTGARQLILEAEEQTLKR